MTPFPQWSCSDPDTATGRVPSRPVKRVGVSANAARWWHVLSALRRDPALRRHPCCLRKGAGPSPPRQRLAGAPSTPRALGPGRGSCLGRQRPPLSLHRRTGVLPLPTACCQQRVGTAPEQGWRSPPPPALPSAHTTVPTGWQPPSGDPAVNGGSRETARRGLPFGRRAGQRQNAAKGQHSEKRSRRGREGAQMWTRCPEAPWGWHSGGGRVE